MLYRVVEVKSSPRTWKIQRKVARLWVTIDGFRDIDSAVARCATISTSETGWVTSAIASAILGARGAGRSWLRAAMGTAPLSIQTTVGAGVARLLVAHRGDAVVLALGAAALWAVRAV